MKCDTLVTDPYVKVRLACRKCNRTGSYSLARLAAKYGPDIAMTDLLAQLADDCAVWERRQALQSRCGAFFIDLDWPPRPPDLPTQGQRRLKVIKGDKSAASSDRFRNRLRSRLFDSRLSDIGQGFLYIEGAPMKRAIILGAMVLCIPAAVVAQSAAEKMGVNSVLGVSPSTPDFVKEVAISDMFEIKSSELAKARADGAAATFAGRMISDHEKTSSELKGLVASGAVKADIPSSLDKAHQDKLDRLGASSGANFAEAYDDDQINAHKSAVDLFERYAKGGDNEALKEWASKTLPTLKSHLEMAEALK